MISPREMVDTFQRVTGIEAEYRSAYRRDELLRYYPSFGANELVVDELIGMVEFAVEYGYSGVDDDVGWSRRLNPAMLPRSDSSDRRVGEAVNEPSGPDRRWCDEHRRQWQVRRRCAALRYMTGDATWWVDGKPHLFPSAGTKTRAEAGMMLRAMFDAYVDGIDVQPPI